MSRPFTKLSDSFKILRDNLNTTSYNVGDPDDLLTHGDSDVVMAINEIERVFDASAGVIEYPTGRSIQGETATRLLITTAQASGTDIQMDVGANFNVNAVGDINLDAGGANINFLDDSVARINFTLGATNVVDVTGILDLNISSNLDADISGNSVITSTGSQIQEGTNLLLDFSGDITLDADGNDIIFKNGAGNKTVTNNIADAGDYTMTAPESYLVSAGNDISLSPGGDISLHLDRTNSGANYSLKDDGVERFGYVLADNDSATNTITATGNLVNKTIGTLKDSAASYFGNFTGTHLTVTGNFISVCNGTLTTSSGAQTHTSLGAYNVNVTGAAKIAASTTITLDAAGDIILDAAGDDVILKDTGTEYGRFKHAGANQLGIYSNGILTATLNDSDIVFNNDVNIENDLDVDRDLNVDRNTTLNGNVDLGNATGDTISFLGRVDTNIVPSTDGAVDLGSAALEMRHGFFDGTVTTDSLVADSADIANFNVVSNTISNPNAVTLDGGDAVNIDTHTGALIFKQAGNNRLAYSFTNNHQVLTVSGSSMTTNAHLIRDSAVTAHLTIAGTSLEQTAGTTLSHTSGGAMTQTSGGNWTANVTGNALINASGDITLDADGNDIIFKNGAGGDTVTHTLADNGLYTVQAPSGYVVNAVGDIVLDADGGDVVLRDNGVQFGKMKNSSDQLDIYSGTTLAVAMDASKVEIHGRAFFVDSAVNTVAQNIAGSINELHTQLDSAVSEILVNKGNIASNDTELANHLSRLDSDATFLQSNLGRIDTNSANIATNVSNITAVNTLVGTLAQLDSSAPGGFFKGINNDSIVKALNELASRTVLIYDEIGTLLN